MVREGFDYGAGPIPPSVIKGASRNFVCRYVAPGKWTKMLAPELKEILASGLDLVTIWELTKTRSVEGGFDGGAADMAEAMNYIKSIGGPANTPVYIAADDFGAITATDFTKIKSYVDGAVSVRGWNLTGAYGGIRTIKYLADRNTCKYYWQTFAWSSGQWDQRAQLQQYKNEVPLGSYTVDYDRAMVTDFGQWGCDELFLELFGEVNC